MIATQWARQSIWAALLVGLLNVSASYGVNKFWDGSDNGNWHDGDNWSPTCSGGPICALVPPGPTDNAILTSAPLGFTTATLSGDASIRGLTIGGGIDVNTGGFQLAAAGGSSLPTTVSGAGSTLILPHAPNAASAFFTHQFHISGGGHIALGGFASPGAEVEIGEPGSTIGVGSSLSGNGTIYFDNFGGGPTTDVLQNDGTIRAVSGALNIITDGAFDLDGASGNGVVDVDDGTFLSTSVLMSVFGPLTDAFDGTIQIGRGDRLKFFDPWQLGATVGGSGLVEMNGVDGVATLGGDRITVRGTNTQMNVVSGTANFAADMNIREATMNVGSNTTVRFSGEADFGSNSKFITGSGYDMLVDDVTVFRQATVDWDSGNAAAHTTTISRGAVLEFQTDRIENVGANQFDGTVVLNGGVLGVQNNVPWILEGRMELNNIEGTMARVSGQKLIVGNGFNVGLDGLVDVGGRGESRITAEVDFRSDAEIQIAATAQLRIINTVAIEAGAQITGPGPFINDGNLTTDDGVVIATRLENVDQLTITGPATFGELTVDQYEQSGTFSRLNIGIRSAQFDVFDRLTVVGNATLDGILDVDLVNPVLPALGEQFPVLTASSISGSFSSTQLPSLATGNAWNVQYNPTSVVLEVIADVDLDNDGDVDGNDFLLIQQMDPALIPAWKLQFGSGVVPLAQALQQSQIVQAVPEPATMVLIGFCLATLPCNARRMKRRVAGSSLAL